MSELGVAIDRVQAARAEGGPFAGITGEGPGHGDFEKSSNNLTIIIYYIKRVYERGYLRACEQTRF